MATTPYLSVEIPDVGADLHTWGDINNAAHVAWDAIFKTDGTGTSVSIQVGTSRVLNAADGELRVPYRNGPSLSNNGEIALDSATGQLNFQSALGQLVSVDTVSVQTINNKTLATPVFSGMPTISGLQSLTTVSSAAQTRTFALGSGIVARISANQSFTLAATGTAQRRCEALLFVQATSGNVTISAGSNVVVADALGAGSIYVSGGSVALVRFIWTGTQLICTDPIDSGLAAHVPFQSTVLTYPSA